MTGATRSTRDAKVTVLHPDQELVDVASVGTPPDDPNELASPLLVEWNDVRLLLGSDRPRREGVPAGSR